MPAIKESWMLNYKKCKCGNWLTEREIIIGFDSYAEFTEIENV